MAIGRTTEPRSVSVTTTTGSMALTAPATTLHSPEDIGRTVSAQVDDRGVTMNLHLDGPARTAEGALGENAGFDQKVHKQKE